ncbi:TIGR04282 family arsenosugar biosynthesis glycosyltransferase [Alkalimarinus coralli]|uniref:TIGR04282 family arsenosugar biosynthesis glycosyltransferase n=1 Tax=Alkalimarinus coralli TaxID=2935863 RepID=UPI00202B2499|nr:TIGR04282 family arsenosugar biosynthesis glycosyltransferase [Alkalimarinus coralli]
MTHTLLIQFAKWPRLGQVKTRLAKRLGEQAAYDAHIELTQTVMRNLTSSGVGSVELWFDQSRADNADSLVLKRRCQEMSIPVLFQKGENLGERMFHGLSRGLENFGSVIIVGSDCPTVNKAYLEKAAKALQTNDLVLGPAEDGGYVLIGARKVQPSLLDGIKWGEGDVLQSTINNAKRLGLSCQLLETTWDVDEYEDYLRWKK